MPHNSDLIYEFGPFQLNTVQRVLTRGGEVISLSPKTMDTLLVLVRRAGELVEKEELMREVWPDSFVEEGNVSQAVFNLRRALGDHRSDAQFIETVSRHGYRFVAQVRQLDRGAHKPNPLVTLAVLPFVNDTGDAQLEYLADGVGENIIRSLSQISKLRVMSRSSIGRFKGRDFDLKYLATELRVGSLLVGRFTMKSSALVVSVELIDGADGWLLWGESVDCSTHDILEVQDEIVRRVSAALQLDLSRDEEKQITARYTNNSKAYQAYLEGRFQWSHFTRTSIETAIGHFRKAIDLDPSYALAYAGIIDCYLRLVANYLPPERELGPVVCKQSTETESDETSRSRLRLRHEWDWKAAERELRRAKELKVGYPAAHQWHAAYFFARTMYLQKVAKRGQNPESHSIRLPEQIGSITLTPSEEAQVFCLIAREQIVVGNYEGARLMVERWLPKSGWPKLDHLDAHMAADLLMTLGTLIGVLSLAGRIPRGIRRAECFLSAAIGLFEQLGARVASCEAQIELGKCYYREGLFSDSQNIVTTALLVLPEDEGD